MATCPNCQNNLPEGATFCGACGTQINAAPVAPVADAAPVAPYTTKAPAFNLKKLLAIAIPVVAIVVVAVILLSAFSTPKNDKMVYSKNGNYYITDGTESFRLGEANSIKFNPDGSVVFFLKESKLYYADVDDIDNKTQIASDVSEYILSKDADVVIYKRSDKNAIYRYELGDEEGEKIVGDASLKDISPDGNRVYYTTEKGYFVKEGVEGDAEKICDENGTSVSPVDDDLTTFYYVQKPKKDDNDSDSEEAEETKKKNKLFKVELGNDAVEICGDVEDLVVAYEDGAYYTTAEGKSKTVKYGNYDIEMTFAADKLFFYNGSESLEVTDSFKGTEGFLAKSGKLLFTYNDFANVKDKYESYDEADTDADASEKMYVASEEKCYVIDLADVEDMDINEDCTTLYMLADYTGEDNKEGTIYEVDLSDGSTKKLYDGVSSFSGEYDGALVYYKRVSDDERELYIDDELVAVDADFAAYNKETGDFFYELDDALYVTTGGKGEKISDDVADLGINDETGDVYYIKDVGDSFGGDLYLYGEDEPIDRGVSSIRFYSSSDDRWED